MQRAGMAFPMTYIAHRTNFIRMKLSKHRLTQCVLHMKIIAFVNKSNSRISGFSVKGKICWEAEGAGPSNYSSCCEQSLLVRGPVSSCPFCRGLASVVHSWAPASMRHVHNLSYLEHGSDKDTITLNRGKPAGLHCKPPPHHLVTAFHPTLGWQAGVDAWAPPHPPHARVRRLPFLLRHTASKHTHTFLENFLGCSLWKC